VFGLAAAMVLLALVILLGHHAYSKINHQSVGQSGQITTPTTIPAPNWRAPYLLEGN
jgi:hypothetical protein